jgi:hypothetical protein
MWRAEQALQAAQQAAEDGEISEKEAEKLHVRIARLKRKYTFIHTNSPL